MLVDIQNRNDIDALVAAFYRKAIPDDLIGHFFTTIKPLNLEIHLPIIADFWEKMLLKTGVYNGSPLQIHMHLNRLSLLEPKHFERWLKIWRSTIDQHFTGPIAALAIERAAMVARSISMQIENEPLFESK
jgi:hemoglobin